MTATSPDSADASRELPSELPLGGVSATATAPSAGFAAPQASAQAAVEAVVKLVDAQTAQAQAPVSAVNLAFEVGGAALDVRVEWRGGTVHAEFRTDSADLRTALASQWHATVSTNSASAVHFAPAVFTSGGQTGSGGGSSRSPADFSASSGQGGASGQGRPAWTGGGSARANPSAGTTSVGKSAASAPASGERTAEPEALTGALRLNAFA